MASPNELLKTIDPLRYDMQRMRRAHFDVVQANKNIDFALIKLMEHGRYLPKSFGEGMSQPDALVPTNPAFSERMHEVVAMAKNPQASDEARTSAALMHRRMQELEKARDVRTGINLVDHFPENFKRQVEHANATWNQAQRLAHYADDRQVRALENHGNAVLKGALAEWRQLASGLASQSDTLGPRMERVMQQMQRYEQEFAPLQEKLGAIEPGSVTNIEAGIQKLKDVVGSESLSPGLKSAMNDMVAMLEDIKAPAIKYRELVAKVAPMLPKDTTIETVDSVIRRQTMELKKPGKAAAAAASTVSHISGGGSSMRNVTNRVAQEAGFFDKHGSKVAIAAAAVAAIGGLALWSRRRNDRPQQETVQSVGR